MQIRRFLTGLRLTAVLSGLVVLSGCESKPATMSSNPVDNTEYNAVKNDSTKTSKVNSEDEAPAKDQVPMVSKSTSLKQSSKFNALNKQEEYVILHKGTERAWTGEYTDWKQKGTFICRRCNAPLYKTDSKFDSHCGWPSFDDQIGDSVERHVDADGVRIEITCKNCGGHLGHVFEGEGFTAKDTRHCVNSISIKFIAEEDKLPDVIKPE